MKIEVNEFKFKGIGELKKYLQTLLHSYPANQDISKEDLCFLTTLMKQTYHGMKKIGVGVSKIRVEETPYRCNGFTVYRTDGSKDDFSYKNILPSTSRKTHSNHENAVIGAFREIVTPKAKIKGNHMHHDGETFNEIYKSFLLYYNLDSEKIELIEPLHGIKDISDKIIKQNFIEYHNARVVWLELSPEEHVKIHGLHRDVN